MKKSRYIDFKTYREKILSKEKNQVTIQREALLSIALVFPNSYAVGMANLGFQTIYRLFNQFSGVRCERAFLYDQFPEITKTLESGEELRNFDVIAFSISYELDFPNLVRILNSAGITPFSTNRHAMEPLVMAGGAIAFMNPTPIAPFIDFFYLGEIEPQLQFFLPLLLQFKQERWGRSELLDRLAEEQGIYVTEKIKRNKIKKVYQSSRESTPQYSLIISPDSHFKNMFLIEVGRGCGRHCHFCAASHIYHPSRIFSKEKILNVIQTYCQDTKRIGLIGAALSDYPHLFDLSKDLVDQGYELGLSSFRLDVINSDFLSILERSKVRSLTFAPEAGTESLRNRIHKNLLDEQIMEAARAIAGSKIQQVKLYFMIGLPTETDEDIQGIVHLVRMIQQILAGSRQKKSINVSVNTFIPKPFTPFQWSPMEKESEIRHKRRYLEREFKKIPGVQFTRKSVKEEILQGIFSLGDREVTKAIYYKIKNNTDWHTAWQQTAIDVDSIIHKHKKFEDELPWEFIEYGIPKERLLGNWFIG
ncbi:MAG: radical SAM protein [bacterium]|nr:MAG: radical SAM protein [bacterium]